MKYLLNLRTAFVVNRVTMGVFFFISGIANYLNFSIPNGFYQTVIWMCIAYDAHEQKMSRRRAQAADDYTLNVANDEM